MTPATPPYRAGSTGANFACRVAHPCPHHGWCATTDIIHEQQPTSLRFAYYLATTRGLFPQYEISCQLEAKLREHSDRDDVSPTQFAVDVHALDLCGDPPKKITMWMR